MPFPLTIAELSLLIVAGAFVVIALCFVMLARSVKKTLETVNVVLEDTNGTVNNILGKLDPVLDNLVIIEENVQDTLTRTEKRLAGIENELLPVLKETTETVKSYRSLEQKLEKKIDQHLDSILNDVNIISGNIQELTGNIRQKIKKTEDLFAAIEEAGQTIHAATGITRQGLTGLAVQIASMASGVKTSLDFLSENLFFKGGAEK